MWVYGSVGRWIRLLDGPLLALPSIHECPAPHVHYSCSSDLKSDQESARLIEAPRFRSFTCHSPRCELPLVYPQRVADPSHRPIRSGGRTRSTHDSANQPDSVRGLPHAVWEIAGDRQSQVRRWPGLAECVGGRERLLNGQSARNGVRRRRAFLQYPAARKVRSLLCVQSDAPDGNDQPRAEQLWHATLDTAGDRLRPCRQTSHGACFSPVPRLWWPRACTRHRPAERG